METIIIEESDDLYRRIPPHHIIDKGKISSAAFAPGKNETMISVDIAKLTNKEKSLYDLKNNEDLKPKGYRLASLKAQIPYSLELDCKHVPEKFNPAHANIIGEGLIRRSIRRRLKDNSRIVI